MDTKDIKTGYYYVRCACMPGYTIVSVVLNPLDNNKPNVFMLDSEGGCEDLNDFDFIGPVPPPVGPKKRVTDAAIIFNLLASLSFCAFVMTGDSKILVPAAFFFLLGTYLTLFVKPKRLP